MNSNSSRSSLDLQAISQLPTEQLVALIAEQQRVIDRLSQERDGLQFKLRLDDTAESLLGQAKGFVKELYRIVLNRLTERMYRRLIQDVYAEINRMSLQHVDFQTQLTQQVADEFVLMHRKLETALNQQSPQAAGVPTPTLDPTAVEKLRRVEALLGYTEYRLDFDPDLPKQTSRFPWKGLKQSLKGNYTKVVKFLFKEQRQVNINLLQALQQAHQLNADLLEKVNALQARLERIEGQTLGLSESEDATNGLSSTDVVLNSSDH